MCRYDATVKRQHGWLFNRYDGYYITVNCLIRGQCDGNLAVYFLQLFGQPEFAKIE